MAWTRIDKADETALREVVDIMRAMTPWYRDNFSLDYLRALWRKPRWRLERERTPLGAVVIGSFYNGTLNQVRVLFTGWDAALSNQEGMATAARRVLDYVQESGLPAYTILADNVSEMCRAAYVTPMQSAFDAAGLSLERIDDPQGRYYIVRWTPMR